VNPNFLYGDKGQMASTAIDTPKNLHFSQLFRGHIPELDAIRAFGVTMVILQHMWPYPRGFSKVLNFSWILMDSFFVLSGFLIAGILLDSRSRPDYFRYFYTRRALRILPVYYLLITILTCGSIVLGSGYLYPETPSLHRLGSPWWYFAYLGNVPMAVSGMNPTAVRSSFAPLWSLQVEEQFYLLFPFLVRHLNLKSLARALLALICLSTLLRVLLYRLYPTNTLAQYVLLPCRMEGLALGALIAIRFRMGPWDLSKRKLTFMAVASVTVTCLFCAFVGYSAGSSFDRIISYLISPIACASVVLWLIKFRGSRLTACLRLPAVQHMSNISYGAYLFHVPVAAALVPISVALGLKALSQGYLKVVMTLTLTIILASLSWSFFESPLLRLKDRLFPRQVVPGSAGGPEV
jgi:peptidoglycan/LPS O-acetylase OafA/YrhL